MALPPLHQSWLDRALPLLSADARVLGVAAGGSWVTGTMDEWSDLDLLVVVAPAARDAVMAERPALAARLGPLLAGFTAEHVGEPRMLICLYGPPLLHVDLKFLAPAELAARVEDPAVLWERDGAVTRALAEGTARWPAPDLQWIEDRFWVWVHYVATKLGRGERLETADGIAYLRGVVLGPLAAVEAGTRPQGVRQIERRNPPRAAAIARTVSTLEPAALAAGLRAAIACYRELRERLAPPGLVRRTAAEIEAARFLDGVAPVPGRTALR